MRCSRASRAPQAADRVTCQSCFSPQREDKYVNTPGQSQNICHSQNNTIKHVRQLLFGEGIFPKQVRQPSSISRGSEWVSVWTLLNQGLPPVYFDKTPLFEDQRCLLVLFLLCYYVCNC